MKLFLSILFSLFVASFISKNDSSKVKLGVATSLANFIDYSIVKKEAFNKLAYYQGFDIGLFIRDRWNKFQFQIGVSGGNAYPLFDNLNYYFDVHYLIWFKEKKYHLDIDEKLLFSYSSKPVSFNNSIIRRGLYSQTGIYFYRRFKKFEYGVGYYCWFGNYKVYYKGYLTNSSPFDDKPLREERGFIPTGILNLTARYLFR